MLSFRLALRTLLRSPMVTLVAVVSLALGIGANTAIFSLIHSVLLRALPVPAATTLVNVRAQGPNPGSQSCNSAGPCSVVFSYPMFRDLERDQTSLAALAAFRLIGADLAYRGKSLSGLGIAITGSYFGVLGLTPALGRLIGPEDDRTIGGSPVAVLSHRYWTSELGSDPGVLDQSLMVNGAAFTIVGVAPPEFDGTTIGARPRVFIPVTMLESMGFETGSFQSRTRYWLYAIGRLKDGVGLATAARGLNAIYQPIIGNVEVPLQSSMPDEMMRRFKAKVITLEPGARGQSNLHRETRTPLLLLIGVTGIVLLVACTNVANLLLARAASRQGEMAVRSSLGAQRGQLVAQLLLESGLVAVLAGGLSLPVASATLGTMLSFVPSDLVRDIEIRLDAPVLLFAGALSLATTIVFGLLPALQSTRPDLLAVIQASGGRGSAGRGVVRFRAGLVTAQIGLSMTLLCAAGLFVRSLINVSRIKLGLRADSVVTFTISPVQMGYSPGQRAALFRRLEESLASIPGVDGVTSSTVPILVGWSNGGDVDVEGFQTTLETDVNVRRNEVGPGYFAVMGIPVVAGRDILPSDGIGTSPVAVVNEAFVKQFGLGSAAIGKRVSDGNAASRRPDDPPPSSYQIVGVVANAAYNEVKGEPQSLLFRAHRQDSTTGRLVYYLRTKIATASIVQAIAPLVAGIDPNLPVSDLSTLPDRIRENVFLDRMITSLSAFFAVIATLLAAVGLYGVLAYNVAQRTREIGVRMALGADGSRVRALVLGQVGRMTMVGGVIGLAAALGVGRLASSLLFGVEGFDLPAFAAAALAITAVALTAGYLPARRASRIHPTQALRGE